MPPQKKDQRIEIRFLVKEGVHNVEIIRRMQRVHGANCVSESTIKRWANWFRTGQDSVDNRPKSGAPKKRTPAKLAQIQQVVQREGRSSIQQIATEVKLSFGTVRKALHKDLNMSKLSARWIPHLLSDPQKVRRMALARAALQHLQSRIVPVDTVIAEDESWMFVWDPESRQASKQWIARGGERPTKVRIEQSTLKTMLVAFVDKDGPIHCEFVPRGHGIDTDTYLQILIRFRESLRRKRPQIWRSGRWCLLQDGAPSHRARPVMDWFGRHRIHLLPHPGYSPDLNPMDYWFFDRVKKSVKGHRYHDLANLRTAVLGAIDAIPLQEFNQAFARLPDRLRKCVQSRGNYFVERRQ